MIVRQKEHLNQILNMLKSSLYWSWDIESTGLNVRKDKTIGFGSCNPLNLNQYFYIITKEWVDNKLVELLTAEDVAPVLQALKSKRLITFNGSYDTRLTYHYHKTNLIDSIYCDVMLLVHTCDENRVSYKMKDIAAETFGNSAKDSQKDMLESIKANGGTEKEYYKADSNLMALYGIQDNILTCKLFNHYNRILKAEGLEKFFYEDEVMPLYRLVTIPMELKGVPLDLPLMISSLEEINIDMGKLHTDIQAAIEPELEDFKSWYLNKEYPGIQLSGQFLEALCQLIAPANWPKTKAGTHSFSKTAFKKLPELLETDLWAYQQGNKRISKELADKVRLKLFQDSGEQYMFNVLSKHHLKKLFFEQLKETPTSTTDKGSAQVEDDFLEQMAQKYEWVKWLRTYNKLTKIKSTYIERFLDKQEDGIFYPSYFQHRTVSGRFGSDLQQIPRPIEYDDGSLEVKYTNQLRKFFIAGPGMKFVDDDYESLEPHVFAHVSGDERLKDIFRNNHDFYSTIAIATEGLTEYSSDKKAENYLGKKDKSKRQTAKAYSLGVPYGMGAYALAMSLSTDDNKVSDKEAQHLINSYLNAYPELKQWMADSEKFAMENGYVRIETGRIRHFPELPVLVNKHKGVDMTNHLEIWKAYNERYNDYQRAKEDGKKIRNYLNNAKNVQIQGLSASIVNRASVALAKELTVLSGTNYICAQIHDEVIVRCEESNVDIVSKIVKDKLENTYRLSIALKAPPSVGNNFAEAKG